MESTLAKPLESEKKPLSEAQLEAKRKGLAAAQIANEISKQPKVCLELPQDGAPQVLQDMRHVYLNAACFDRTPGQKEFRKDFKKGARAFVKQMMDMERDHAASRVAEATSDGKVDERAEVCVTLLRELMSRMKANPEVLESAEVTSE